MSHTKLAAQLYTVRAFTQTEDDFEETIKKVKDIGYDVVQLSAIGAIEPERIREILNAQEMKVCITHTPMNQLLNACKEVIKEHRLWGCSSIGLGHMGKEAKSLEEIKAFCASFNQVAEHLQKEGMCFYYHNHAFEFERFEGKNVFDIMEETTSPKQFKFLVDTYWLQYAGNNPSRFIERYKNRIDKIHIKDMSIVNNKPMTTEIGLGNMDIEGIIETCEMIGVDWYIVEQDDSLRDPFESLKISLKNLKSMGLK